LDKKIGNQAYYQGWKDVLVRQEDIIRTLHARMVLDEPFRTEEQQLVYEYNNNWSKAPKNG
jgi:hypothetical protein